MYLKNLLEQQGKHLILISDIYTVDNNFFDNPIHPYFYMPFIGDGEIDKILKNFIPKNIIFGDGFRFLNTLNTMIISDTELL